MARAASGRGGVGTIGRQEERLAETALERVAEMADVDVLLDAIDRRTRIAQHGLIFAGVVTLLFARGLVESSVPAALAAIAAGLILFAAAAAASQRWVVKYQGHDVAIANNPLRGERLLLAEVRRRGLA